ncbi:MAG: TonB-dependent receptor plug domain-containing protein, partial [Sulfitobacter pontiacus]|uniref:TonB-dependent receptor plug domain-containing protein n=2 Tax=Sulfitobacter TaxID=60136 RepID=UPI00329A44C7
MSSSKLTHLQLGRGSIKTALLCCTALVPGALSAQETYQLDDVILEASAQNSGAADAETVVANELSSGGKLSGEIINIPASVSVITSREIEARGADSVEQVLNYTAGATTDSYGADDRF